MPAQGEVDRLLSAYEALVQVDEARPEVASSGPRPTSKAAHQERDSVPCFWRSTAQWESGCLILDAHGSLWADTLDKHVIAWVNDSIESLDRGIEQAKISEERTIY